MTPTHEIRIVSTVGPGGSVAYAACSCDWWGPVRLTRTDANPDGAEHLREVLRAEFGGAAPAASTGSLTWEELAAECADLFKAGQRGPRLDALQDEIRRRVREGI